MVILVISVGSVQEKYDFCHGLNHRYKDSSFSLCVSTGRGQSLLSTDYGKILTYLLLEPPAKMVKIYIVHIYRSERLLMSCHPSNSSQILILAS